LSVPPTPAKAMAPRSAATVTSPESGGQPKRNVPEICAAMASGRTTHTASATTATMMNATSTN
jgi:hypothetical protein